MIRVFPSPFSKPDEHEPVYSAPSLPGETLADAVTRLVPSYDPTKPCPWQCAVNGIDVPSEQYNRTILGPDTTVDFFLTPRGDVINTVLNIFTLGAWNLVMKFLTPKVGNTGSTSVGSQRDRDDLDQSTVKANTVKQGAIIREKFGTGRVYPDHLTQVRRYFVAGAPTRQASEMLLCVGRGKFQFDIGRSKVGETTQAALGSNLTVRTYAPGADLSAESFADNWYTSSEVGGTSGGSAGLDLTVITAVQQNAEASTYVLSASSVTIPAGAGTWPTGWEAGMLVRILAPYNWTITDGGPGLRDRISGPWAQVGPFVGMKLEIAGGYNGLFTVASVVMYGSVIDYVTLDYTDGNPVTALPIGTYGLTVGYEGLRYRMLSVTSQVITVERLTDTGSVDSSWPGFDSLTSSAARFTLDASTVQSGWSGPYAATPAGALSDRLEIDFFYPAGLYMISDAGNPQAASVRVEVQYRNLETAGDWTAVEYRHVSSKIAQVGFTETIGLPYPMRAEVRVRRISVDSNASNRSDQVQWYGLKSRLLERPDRYPDLTVAAVRVFGGGALAAQAEQMVSFWVTRILPRRVNGAWAVEGPTRSIVDAALYIAKDRGYDDSRLDLAEWDRLGAIWEQRGDFFDGSFEKETTAEQAMNVICRPGYAQVVASRGVLRPVRDALRSEAEKASARLYGTANSSNIQRSGQPVNPNDVDAVDVKYVNPVTWTTETVKCRLPGMPAPNKITQLTLEGVNDRTRAWRLGMREITSARYRRWRNTWSTGMDSFASNYMDYCELQDDVPDLAINGHLRDWDGQKIFESNEPIGDSTLVAMRKPDGTKFGPVPLTRIDEYTFTFDEPLDFVPITETDGSRAATLLFLGKSVPMLWPVLISSVTPSGQFRANVEALGYDERVYQFDDLEPPADA